LAEPSTRVSAQDIAEYYRRNKAKLIVDERRDVRLVVATTRARADAARAALGDGQSWKVVARKYSVHREKGGKIADVREGGVQTGLVATIFPDEEGRAGRAAREGGQVLGRVRRREDRASGPGDARAIA
jgi:hypothetical protein